MAKKVSILWDTFRSMDEITSDTPKFETADCEDEIYAQVYGPYVAMGKKRFVTFDGMAHSLPRGDDGKWTCHTKECTIHQDCDTKDC